MKRKWLAVGIILLFVGVTIAPTINFNTVKASQDDDLVEVTTQACGIKGYDDTTVKLTREQYAEIQKLFDDVQTQLDATNTIEDALPIYYNAIVELNKYGLLPQGMSVETAQKFITRSYKYTALTKFFKESGNNLTNALCFIVGNFSDWGWLNQYGPLLLIFLTVTSPIFIISFLITLFFPESPVFWVFLALLVIELHLSTFSPVKLMNWISLGQDWTYGPAEDYVYGTIDTIGILGTSSMQGRIKGIIAGFTGLGFFVGPDIDKTVMLLGFSLFTYIYKC